MTIFIDNRVGSRELAPYIKSSVLTTLNYGDVAFMGNGPDGMVSIGIERKTIRDLINGMTTGRLSGYQLLGLYNSYTHPYLLIEGIWRPKPEDGILQTYIGKTWQPLELGTRRFMYREVCGYLFTLQEFGGLKLWFTSTIQESAQWITVLYNWWQKPWDKHRSHLAFSKPQSPGPAPFVRPNLVHRMAAELDGIGWHKGGVLGDRYDTPMELCNATMDELVELPGIGKKLAESIVRELNGG